MRAALVDLMEKHQLDALVFPFRTAVPWEIANMPPNTWQHPEVRNHLEVVLAQVVLDASALTGSAAYCAAERLTADRMALGATGDLRAGLAALCPPDNCGTAEERRASLTGHRAIADLLAFASRLA